MVANSPFDLKPDLLSKDHESPGVSGFGLSWTVLRQGPEPLGNGGRDEEIPAPNPSARSLAPSRVSYVRGDSEALPQDSGEEGSGRGSLIS